MFFKNLNCGALEHKATFEQQVKLAKAFGFGGVDLDLGFIREKGAQAAKELLDRNGLRPGGFGMTVAFREGDSEKQWAESLGAFQAQVKQATEVGATRCYTWVPPASDKEPFRRGFARFVRRLKPAAEILAAHGCRMGLEFIGPRTLRAGKKYGFLHTMDGMRAATALLGENTGLLLDCWHWHTCQSTVTDLEQLEPGDVVYVHLNDAPEGIPVTEQVDNRRELPAATGVIDLPGFLGALQKIGYDGPITVEPFNQALREMPIEEAVKATAASLEKALARAGV